jgi:xyloglucan 6-xylosyltransferase
MLLVTASSQPTTAAAAACQTSMGDHLLLMSIKNKIDYCRVHSIEIFYNVAQLEPEMVDSWAKLLLIRKLMLEHPQAEWIWWMDSEAMVTDMSFQVPVEKYQNHNLVMQGSFDNNNNDKSWDTGLHTESFLIRNCQWSLNFLDAWAGGRPIIGSSSSIRNKGGGVESRSLSLSLSLSLLFQLI